MRLLPLWLALGLLASSAAAPIPFPHEASDLKMDPTATFGTLPNGLRYVVRANREPKDRASLRLLVEAGAVHERDDQQGLAHFLEHMAFNGSKHFPPSSLIEFFQRMGMSFGGDTNASTSFTRTLYLLELPNTRPETLGEGLKVLRDYTDGLLLGPEEIERERGIILSEKRTRDSAGYRTSLATRNFLLQGSLFARRDLIGPEKILREAGRELFQDFYDAWYRPELMSVVIVGDIDVPAVVRQLETAFRDLQPRAPARPAPDLGRVAAFSGVTTFYHHEAEASDTDVSIMTITPHAREPDTAANRLKYLPRQIAHAIINRRLSILAKQEDAPFRGGGAGADEAFGFYRQTSIGVTCKAEQWSEALGVAEQELRRALEHGFQPAELREVLANYRNSLEQAVKTAATRRSDSIAGEIAQALLDREVWTSPADDLALYGPALERVTVEACHAALRAAWSPAHRLVLVTGNARLPAGEAAQDAIRAAFEKSRAVAVAPPARADEAPWGYGDFGPPGEVARRESVPDLGITLLTFANGVRLNLKPTDFEANRIRVSVRIGSGQLTEPRDQPGLATYLNQTYNEGGLGRHSVDDLRRLLAGRTVGASLGAGQDAFVVNGITNREDLLLQLQLATARITDPGFRPEAARQAKKALDEAYLSFAHTAAGPFNLEVARLLASGDPRFGLPPEAVMARRNLDEVKAWVRPELQHGAVEVAIVGDFEPEAAIAAVARTLGTLPPRRPKPALGAAKVVEFPAEPFQRHYEIPTEIPKGTVAIYWPTTDSLDVRRGRRLNLLAEVLKDRLRVKVREELGEAYNPGVGSAASDLFPGYGYLQSLVTVDPAKAAKLVEVITSVAADLAEKGVTEEELERAKKPVLTSLRESSRSNAYWLGAVLARAQERPEVLDWCRSRYADNEGITAAELSALAKQYLPATRASRVTVVPRAAAP